MKKTLIALAAAAATGFGAVALADEAISDPVMMSDNEMAQLVGGTRFTMQFMPASTPDDVCPVGGQSGVPCWRGTDSGDASYDGLVKAVLAGHSKLTGIDKGVEPKPQGKK